MTTHQQLRALLTAAVLSLVLFLLPLFVPALHWLAWPLRMLATVFHELGHGLAALLFGGGFQDLRIYADGSGVATTLSDGSRGMRAAIAAGGPLAPPMAALALFLAALRPGSARIALHLLVALLLIACLFWLRTAFGLGFVLVLAALLFWIALRASTATVQSLSCFLAIELSLAAFARVDYLFSAQARTGGGLMPSDTAQIADALWLPYWVWGGLIALLSLAILGIGLWRFAAATVYGPAPRSS